jgi:hypothetical protein
MTIDPLARLKGNLLTIADAYAALADRDRDTVRDERVKPGHDRRHRDGKGGPLVNGLPDGSSVLADPVAAALPGGPTKQASSGPVVSGSHAAPVPVNLDLVDLTAPARRASMDLADTSPWRADQTGHLSVATELDFWVRDIADLLGDRPPRPNVPELATWLHERAAWAWDHYGALGEMAVKLERLARLLYALQNPGAARVVAKAAPCPGCRAESLTGDGETVQCSFEDCGRVLTEAEYAEWSRLFLHRELLGPSGISAREIALRYARPMGTVHRWASQYDWARTRDGRRPVLYLRSEVEESVEGILAREAEQASRDAERVTM